MIDLYADERAKLEALAAETTRLVADAYAGQVAFMVERGDQRRAMELMHQAQEEISRMVAPIAALLAHLPMRPVLIDTDKLTPEQRKALGR